jgi:hypothetical protein
MNTKLSLFGNLKSISKDSDLGLIRFGSLTVLSEPNFSPLSSFLLSASLSVDLRKENQSLT